MTEPKVKEARAAPAPEGENALDNSRPLDVHTWSDHPEVNAFVDRIFADHFVGGNEGIRKKHLKVVLLDLYVAWSDDPELKVTVSRNVNDYKAKSRYNALHISKLTIPIVDRLLELGLIEQRLGFFDRREGGRSRVSRVWPTDVLIQMFREARFKPLDIDAHEGRECIVLRDVDPESGKRFEVEYEDTDETNRMREVLNAYNDLLRRTHIDIPTLETNFIELEQDDDREPTRLHVNQRSKFVRRIFNRGSWEKGGRFFGGWWQRCPKEWREAIFINDGPTSEIDYSGLHIVLLYGQEGIDYWNEIGGDPYEIDLPELEIPAGQLRDLCKMLVLVALNAKTETSAYQAFRSQADVGSFEKTMKNDDLGLVLARLMEKHAPIAYRFASDAGIDLMNVDARITERIIDHFTDQEIPILTIHDSYIVPDGMEKELEDQMKLAFEAITGVRNVELKEVTHHPEAWEPMHGEDGIDHKVWEEMMERRHNPPRTERYLHNREEFLKWLA